MAIFPLKRKEEILAGKRSGNFAASLLYDMRINGDSNSPQDKLVVKTNGKSTTLFGRYETVLFLTDYEHAPLIKYHKKGENDRILSAYNFDIDECPVYSYFKSVKDLKTKTITGGMDALLIPVLSIRRQTQPNRTKSGGTINPVNWFEMEVSSYREICDENHQRLIAANNKYDISKYYYKIFAPDRAKGVKQAFYFLPMSNKGEAMIVDGVPMVENPWPVNKASVDKLVKTEHPMVVDWMEDGKFIHDDDYYSMIACLAILKFQKFTHPETAEVYDYNGYYEQALEVYKQYKERFPSAVDKSEEAQEQEEDLPF